MRCFLSLTLLAGLPLWGQDVPHPPVPKPPSARSTTQGGSTEGVPTFTSSVRLVSIFTSVEDQRGAPVAGLEQQDFRLYEDGLEQKISIFERDSSLPLSMILGVDASLSTRKDLPLELTSARRFAEVVLRPADGMSIYEFDDRVSEIEPFTSDLKQIDRALGRIKPGTATALYDTIYLASQALQHRPGRKVMILITDGGDTSSSSDYAQALRAAQSAEAIIYSIIMVPVEADAGRDLGGEHALIQLSEDTGGRHYYATNLAQLDAAFRQISDELRTQYLLAYYPSHKNDSGFHALRLEVKRSAPDGKAYKALCRSGYYINPGN